MIELPEFFNNPSIIEIGNFRIQYYALTWILSAILIFQHLKRSKILAAEGLSHEQINDMVFIWGLFFGAMFGGRAGYMIFYGTEQLISNPLSLFYVWQGGLSFHGGLLGVIASMFLFSVKKKISFLSIMDAVALSMPIGLGLVRLGNFLNGELFGKPTSGSWGFIFPTDPYGYPRHPSQIYELILEGFLLFYVLHLVSKLKPKPGVIASSLLIFYGLFRFSVEFFREPDAHLGYITFNLSMGQILSLPMIIIGIILVLFFSNKYAKLS